jgi:hypothetical protein
VQFLDVFIRQAHPGERHGAYEREEQKVAEARDYQRDEALPWPVLIDDFAGTTHQTYGNMSDPVYLIDADGRVAFYGMWTHVPTLKRALDELLVRGGRGASEHDGIDHMIHLFASFVNGWHALQRGGWQAVIDYEIGTPGAATLTFLGHVAKPLLAPVALRVMPLPRTARFVLGGSVAVAAALMMRSLRHRD